MILVLGGGLGLRVMVRGYTPVPFADFWAQFPLIERALRAQINLTDLWVQWNEHRIPLSRLQFIADYGLFRGTNVFLFGSIAASCLALAAVFAVAVWRDTRDPLLTGGTLAAAAAATMSPAGIENFTWAFQVAFVQAFLFAAVAILAVVLAARGATTGRRGIATGVCALAATAATYSLVNGLLAWFVVVALAVLLRLDRRLTAALIAAGVVTIGTFLWRFSFGEHGDLTDPVGLVHFVAVFLGSVVWGAGAGPAAIVGVAGLALVPVVSLLAWRDRASSAVAAPFGAALAVFILLTAAASAAGRLDLGVVQALSSRYSIAAATFWLALLVALLPTVRERAGSRQIVAPAYLAAAGVVALFAGFRQLPADAYLPTLVMGRELTVAAYLSGVEDGSQLTPVGQAGPGVSTALEWMERERLGPWAPGGLVDGMAVGEAVAATNIACRGRIEATVPIAGGTRISGWIDPRLATPTSRHVVVLDGSGTRIGHGLVGAHRPDARELGAADDWRGFVAYARGSPARANVMLLDESGAAGVCRLRRAVA